MIPDIINGLFELGGALMISLNIMALHRDKRVKGINPITIVFFAVWGYWGLFYYPHLGQWWSFGAGALLATLNTVWCGMMVYYSKKNKRSRARAIALDKAEWVLR